MDNLTDAERAMIRDVAGWLETDEEEALRWCIREGAEWARAYAAIPGVARYRKG